MMKLNIPRAPFLLKVEWPSVLRRFPLARGQLRSIDLITYALGFFLGGAGAGVVALLLPMDLKPWAAQVMWAGLGLTVGCILILLYRWIVVCPVCENGETATGPMTAYQCPHCGTDYAADPSVTPATPWGE